MALAPAAVELASLYVGFDCMLAETFGDTASREYLIRLCADRGITPKTATYAVLELETDVEVPVGTRFTGGDRIYKVTASGQVTCEQPGAAGNEFLGGCYPGGVCDGSYNGKTYASVNLRRGRRGYRNS